MTLRNNTYTIQNVAGSSRKAWYIESGTDMEDLVIDGMDILNYGQARSFADLFPGCADRPSSTVFNDITINGTEYY
jgi:hypothetical protein